MQTETTRTAERTAFGMLMTLAAGAMDAYSYLDCGQVFATGQTGNFVLLGLRLAGGDWAGVLHYAAPIACFWAGVFLASHLLYRFFAQDRDGWSLGILCAETLLFAGLALLPAGVPDLPRNAVISLCAAMQFCCFRQLPGGAAYASVFCTGNMRSCAEALYLGLVQRVPGERRKAGRYASVLASFLAGVLLGVLNDRLLGRRGAAVIAGLLFLAALILRASDRPRRARA